MDLIERTAQIAAHRACCGTEHDPANGKLHGYCVVCGVPWPCEYAGVPPKADEHRVRVSEIDRLIAMIGVTGLAVAEAMMYGTDGRGDPRTNESSDYYALLRALETHMEASKVR